MSSDGSQELNSVMSQNGREEIPKEMQHTKLLNLLAEIAAHRETVLYTTKEVDLIWLPNFEEQLLRSVALLSWEDLVSLSRRNG